MLAHDAAPSTDIQTSLNSERVGSWDAAADSAADGVVLLFLHGWKHSLKDLKPMAELAAADYPGILLDLPGFGSSPVPPSVWGVTDYAKTVTDFIDRSIKRPVVVIGHSFGGRVALRSVALRPELFRGLVLIGSSGLLLQPTLKKLLRLKALALLRTILKAMDRHTGTKTFERYFIPRYASRDYQSAGALKSTFVKVVNEDQGPDLPKIQAPALLIWGENDTEAPLVIGQAMNKGINGSRLIVLPGEGHEPFRGEGAHRCAYYIKNFLTDSVGKTRSSG